MRIHVVSDLHLEFGGIDLGEVERDVLVLAGDISVGRDALDFIERELEKSPVIYTLGNHEYYYHNYHELLDWWLSLKREGLFVLENRAVELDGVKFLGSVLWTDMDRRFWATLRDSRRFMTDFSVIEFEGRKFDPSDSIEIHEQTVSWLQQELDREETTVVVTHHLPSSKSIHRKYINSSVNGAFASELDWLIMEYQPDLWVHGHTHESFDYRIGRTRILCNPRGYYPDELNPNFVADLVVEVTP